MEFESRLVEEMSNIYKNAEISITDVKKTNYTYRGIIIRPEGSNIAPTINITDIRKQYEEDNKDFSWVINQVSTLYETGMSMQPDIPEINKDFILENVIYHMVNKERNTELFEKAPCREFQDLILVPYINIKGDGDQCALVTSALMDNFDITAEELEGAIEKNMTPVIKSMRDTIIDIMVSEGMDVETAQVMCEGTSGMYIVSNESKFYGAGNILYGDAMDKVAGMFDDNVLVLPSSVHECILVPSGLMTMDAAREMVRSVNIETVSEKDFLSDNVYEYDKELKKFLEPGIKQEL